MVVPPGSDPSSAAPGVGDRGWSCRLNRRPLLRVLGLTTVSLLTGSLARPALGAEKTAKVLVLGCTDFRFVQTERFFLASQNLSNQYDWTALAGASLALCGYPRAVDREAFWDQLDFSLQQHQIQKVMLLDHQDCAAFAHKFGSDLSQDLERERRIHTEVLSQAYWQILDRYPQLSVELYFMTLEAEIKPILPLPRPQSSPTPQPFNRLPLFRWLPHAPPPLPEQGA